MNISLTLVTFFPLLAAVVLILLPERRGRGIHVAAVCASMATTALSLGFFFRFDGGLATLQFQEKVPWIPSLGVNFHLGLDGFSLLLYVLTTVLTPFALLGAYGSVKHRLKEFACLLLVLETFMLGTLASADLFLFYVFWELMLIPMALLIGVWGGQRRIYATIKFVLFTVAGSLPMLIGILYLAMTYRAEIGSGSFEGAFDVANLTRLVLSPREQLWLFLAFSVSFAIKLPLFPVHTWLPDAHTEAPTAGSVVLAGVMLKMGGFGLLRYAIPLFPEAAVRLTPVIFALGAIGIVYGAFVALAQTDIKKLIAYSSVSHMGLVVLGLFSANSMGIRGGLFQMLAHGLSTGALFLLVGMIYDRRHTREIDEFGGVAKSMPWFAAAFLVATFASVGLPTLCGFVGEFLVLLGVFTSSKVTAGVAALGMILGAWYMLKLFRRVFYGEVTKEENSRLKDLSRREVAVILPLIGLMVLLGVYPMPFLDKAQGSVEALVGRVRVTTSSSFIGDGDSLQSGTSGASEDVVGGGELAFRYEKDDHGG